MPKTVYKKTRFENIFTYDTNKGMRHYVRIRYKDSTGAWKEKTASGLINLTTAKRKKVELQELVNKDQTSTFDADRMTFKQLREGYYKVMSPNWSKNHQATTLSMYKKHLCEFDDTTLNKLNKASYQAFINQKLHEEGMAVHTVKQMHVKMMAVLNYAVDNDILVRNKLGKIKIEKLEIEKKRHLESDELDKLDKLAKSRLCPIKYSCYILMRIGWRKGEATALTRGDVRRINNDTVDVSVTGAQTPHEDRTTPKTKKSYRTNRLTGDWAIAVLDAVDVAERIYKNHNIPFTDGSCVIVNKHTCEPRYYDMPGKMLRMLGRELDMHATPHMLRHSFASHSRKNGNDLVTVANWLGHTPKMSQEVYDHETKESHLKLVEYVNAQ